jgi:hydroxyacid-oxoacid transhydrogenase
MAEQGNETVFTWGAPPLKFGVGATEELGFDLRQLGVERVLVVTDPGVAATGLPERVRRLLAEAGVKAEVYDQVHVEPTDESLRQAAEFAKGTEWDGFLAVGGGSSIDTAKAINLLTADGGDVMEYVNRPVGQGRSPSRPLKPLVAVPTTAGTGAESTTVCILDILGLRLKSGISHPRLRPALAIIDPMNTLTLPATATASAGMDIVCHALESYTARWFADFPRKRAEQRVPYCGANPVSDLWAERALTLVARSFRRAVRHGDDLDARTDMLQAATFAGMGFGNAGVHIPHANGYPIAGMVRDYRPAEYTVEGPLVPHGQSVAVTAPAALRYTFTASPERHLGAAALLGGVDPSETAEGRQAGLLPEVLIRLMRDIDVPSGVAAFGYGEGDIPQLVEGAMKQQRLLAVAPREVTEEALAAIFRESLENW